MRKPGDLVSSSTDQIVSKEQEPKTAQHKQHPIDCQCGNHKAHAINSLVRAAGDYAIEKLHKETCTQCRARIRQQVIEEIEQHFSRDKDLDGNDIRMVSESWWQNFKKEIEEGKQPHGEEKWH